MPPNDSNYIITQAQNRNNCGKTMNAGGDFQLFLLQLGL